MSERDVTSSFANRSGGGGGAARLAAAAALAVLFAWVPPVGATRPPSVRQLDVLTASHGKVWFLQPDGKGTTIDVATGAVTRGGARHDDWPRPRRCEPAWGECRLAAGVLSVTLPSEGQRLLEMRSEKGQWQVAHRRIIQGPPGGVWEVEGALLIHSPQWGISTVECFDIASGRAHWIYAYPTPWPKMGWTPMGERDKVSAARDGLQWFESAVRNRSEGTFDAAEAASGRSYSGAVVVDPDPMRRSTVRVGLLLGWAAVVVTLVLAALRVLKKPAGEHFTALTIGLAVVIVAVGLIDTILTAALWLLFLAAFSAANGRQGAPRALLGTIVVVTAVIVWLPSLMDELQR